MGANVLPDYHRHLGMVVRSVSLMNFQLKRISDSSSFVFASVGYGAGVALYIIFGLFASFSGWAIWKVYLDLDSSRFPMMSFGDPFLRLFGKRSRHFINIAQALQQFLTVAVLIISKSQNLEQLSGSSICFIAAMLICMGIGMVSGIIRSLKKIGWLSNLAVWFNVANFLLSTSIHWSRGRDEPRDTQDGRSRLFWKGVSRKTTCGRTGSLSRFVLPTSFITSANSISYDCRGHP